MNKKAIFIRAAILILVAVALTASGVLCFISPEGLFSTLLKLTHIPMEKENMKKSKSPNWPTYIIR